ncbi:MAG: hypothetical protein ACK5TK_00420 [Betaproteobacteria bacterium]
MTVIGQRDRRVHLVSGAGWSGRLAPARRNREHFGAPLRPPAPTSIRRGPDVIVPAVMYDAALLPVHAMATRKKTANKAAAAVEPAAARANAAPPESPVPTPAPSAAPPSVAKENTKMADETLAAPATDAQRPQVRVAVSPSLGENVVYADGVQSLAIRGGVGHFDLYQILGTDKAGEQRMITHRMVVPIAALNEMLQMLAAAANATRERAQQGAEAAK